MSRLLHFPQGLPLSLAATDRAAFEWFLDLATHAPLTAVPARQGPEWTIDDVIETLAQIAVFRDVRSEHRKLATTQTTISVPHPLDQALRTAAASSHTAAAPKPSHLRAALRNLRGTIDATAAFITAIANAADGSVMFQLNLPSALQLMATTEPIPGGRKLAARVHARATAKLLARLPLGVDVVLNFGDEGSAAGAHVELADLSGPVSYLNQLAHMLHRQRIRRALRQLPRQAGGFPAVRIPLAFGAHGPVQEETFYSPLTELDRRWTRLIAGVVANADLVSSEAALTLFEIAAGRTAFAVGPASALDPCSPQQLATLIRDLCKLCHAARRAQGETAARESGPSPSRP